ncbi:MAG: hypothetical protein PHX08_14650 [Lachnospiraceae bacterium]|nr:hypothetical protein [Lachnospiraceae bacterium]
MKRQKKLITVACILSMALSTSCFASTGEVVCVNGGHNYIDQYKLNWCWAATGVNIFVGLENYIPTEPEAREEKFDFLEDLVEDHVDSVEWLSPENGSYDVPSGLEDSIMIANDLIKNYSDYDNLYYKYYQQRTFSFKRIMSDLEDGAPTAIQLWPTGKTGSKYKYLHCVLVNGADSMFSDSDDYEVRYYDSAACTNKWVNYKGLKSGSIDAIHNKKYVDSAIYAGDFD